MDLLTAKEEAEDTYTGHLRFNIPLLAERLVGATDWLGQELETANLRIGYFGASTGAAALLRLGAREKQLVIVPGATHLFEEPGTLEEVARLVSEWLTRHLSRSQKFRR
jgi:hypothetical protein